MSVQTSRTARYGGAVSTFATGASPGAALATLFGAIDTILTNAGWTKIQNTGSPGPNTYTSPGESGNDFLFIQMTTGGYTASGDIAGGSYLCIATCQWADASGNYCNRLGAPRTSGSAGQPSQSINCLSLAASTTYQYAAVCDKDGICIVATPSGTTNGLRWLWCGVAQRVNGRSTFTTTGTVANGTNVSIGLSGNPITAGYQVGDALILAGQQVGVGTATLGDLVAFRIQAMTTSTITAEYIGGLSQTLSSGALVGEAPQPYHGWGLNTATIGPSEITTAKHVVAPMLGYAIQTKSNLSTTNLWSFLVSSNGTGNIDNATAVAPLMEAMVARVGSPTPSGLGTTGTEPRCNANLIRQIAPVPQNQTPATGGSPGYLKYLWQDQRNAGSPNTVSTIGRALATTEEWVCVTAADTRSYWMGPFPATTPTVRIRKLACTNEYAGEYIILTDSGLSSSDDAQVTIIDRAYPNDYIATVAPQVAVTNLAPSGGTLLQVTDTITGKVTVAAPYVPIIYITFPTPSGIAAELVYDGASFQLGYQAASTMTGTFASGATFLIARNGGWPANINLLFNAATVP